ncbi:MAG: hypothetical protein K2P74_02855 [Nitrosomonas sp.]|nr:hypothetical protein [Nitrosomonas sp.]
MPLSAAETRSFVGRMSEGRSVKSKPALTYHPMSSSRSFGGIMCVNKSRGEILLFDGTLSASAFGGLTG